MSKAQFTIAYDGAALKGGTMDVRDLAPALLAIGQLVDAANNTLNGEEAKISVNVKATQRGSFSITLEVIQSYAQQIVNLFAGTEITAAANILALLGGGAAGRRSDPPDARSTVRPFESGGRPIRSFRSDGAG